ncbi:MAG TPA: hypothetical protein VGM76_09010 [Lacipirellulaceae bacterium]
MSELEWVVILPCGIAALVMLVCKWLNLPARAAWAKSVGSGYVVGQVGLAMRAAGWQAGIGSLTAPREAGDWLPWLVMAAAGITVLAAYAPRNWQRWIVSLAAVIAVAAPARLLAGSVYVTSRWSALEKLGVIMVWSAAFAMVWTLLAAGRANGQPRVRGGLLIMFAVGLAIALAIAGSFTYGELCGVAAAAIAGAVVARVPLSRVLKHDSPADADGDDLGLSGAAGAIAMALGGLILLDYFYAELSGVSAALLVVALVAAGGRLPVAWPRGPTGQIACRAMLCVVPLAIALALAWTAMLAERGTSGY